ncbi:SAM-dependent methyltransferase [Muricoccus radiodurans]|uniref:SAM-dependent methyltransferase n=1 Tax=Muricoccus radiodurans TaxID=2231721 RepID=UPI003CEFE8E5
MTLDILGRVRGGRADLSDDAWDSVTAEIVLDPTLLDETATLGLDSFSHITVVFHFDRLDPAKVQRGARRPRGNPDWPVTGILAQRGSPRPNRLGVTTCRLLKVEGLTLTVQGLDAADGTPVLDIKPHMPDFDPRGEVRQPAWAADLMRGYW